MYSVKLSNVPFGPDQLSMKVKYMRHGVPTPENVLNGFFDYTQIAKTVATLSGDTDARLQHDNRNAARVALTEKLASERSRQNLCEGKFKVMFNNTPPRETGALPSSPAPDTSVRLEGNIEQAAINHGHFQEHQKANATGNSVEALKWIIKLDTPNGQDRTKVMACFDHPEFRKQVEQIALQGLARGDALELVIDAVSDLVRDTLVRQKLSVARGRFSLQRPGLLQQATVVIGKTQQFFGSSNDVDTRTDNLPVSRRADQPLRKYRDFSTLPEFA